MRSSVLPNAFFSHNHRPIGYNQTDYFNEFGVVVQAIENDANIKSRGNLVAPSLQGTWTMESVYDTGFLTTYGDSISIVSVEQ